MRFRRPAGMIRSGGPDRRSRGLRALGAWLGLSYLFATAAGAAGLGNCVHAGLGHGEGHASHGSSDSHAIVDHHEAMPLPCAAGNAEIKATANSPAQHGSSDPCDCLGDCSVGTELPDLSGGCTVVLVGGVAAETTLTDSGTVRDFPNQYLLPFPNAPPLL